MNEIKVFAPATVANLNSGYDLLGLAIDYPGDEVVLTKKESPGLVITKIEGDQGKLPLESEKNCATVAIQSYLDYMGYQEGFEVEIHKKMPIGSGLGSSSASSVAGVFAANCLLGEPLTKKELVRFAMQGEKIACGSAHADNVSPSLLGGIVSVSSYNPLRVDEIEFNLDLYIGVVHPDLEIKTSDSRDVLPKSIPMEDVVRQTGYLSSLLLGLSQGNEEMIRFGLQDVLVEPYRAKLISNFLQIKKIALEMGALGCGISGSGPSIFVMSKDKNLAENICREIKTIFNRLQIDSQSYCSAINRDGAKIICEN